MKNLCLPNSYPDQKVKELSTNIKYICKVNNVLNNRLTFDSKCSISKERLLSSVHLTIAATSSCGKSFIFSSIIICMS